MPVLIIGKKKIKICRAIEHFIFFFLKRKTAELESNI